MNAMKEQTLGRAPVYKMHNETHAAFNEDARELMKKCGIGALGITAAFNNGFSPALDVELALLDFIEKSELTVQVVAQNSVVDDSFRALHGMVRAAARSPVPSKHIAGATIEGVINHYGDITRRAYADQWATGDDLLRELDSPDHASFLTTIGAATYVEDFRGANKRFAELLRDRDEEISKRPGGSMKEARAATDKALDEVLDRVAAMITLNGIDYTTALAPFVHEWKALVERYKRAVGRVGYQRARKEGAGEGNE
jgi:hypothetical protein